MCLTPAVRITSDAAPKLLNLIIGFLVYDGLMGVLNDGPLILINVMALLIFEMLPGLEVAGMSQVARIRQDVNNSGASPGIRVLNLPGLPEADAQLLMMKSRNLYMLIRKDSGYLIRAFAFQCHLIYPFDDRRRHRIDDPLILIGLRLQIPIRHRTAGMLTGQVPGLETGADLLAGVPGVPLVHDIPEGSKLVIPFIGIHVVIERDQPDTVLSKHLHIDTDLKIVTSEAAHILDAYNGNLAFLDRRDHSLKTGTVEACAADPVIGIMDNVGESMLCGIVFQDLLLISNGIGFALQLVIMTESLIQGCNLPFIHISGHISDPPF